MILLDREEFKRQVFARSKGRCVVCACEATSAHHIMDRKLFVDGGYYLENGAAVCDECHWKAETTELSVSAILKLCGLSHPVLPEYLDASKDYDKWGNEMLPDGTRIPGRLFADMGSRRALAKGGFLGLFVR